MNIKLECYASKTKGRVGYVIEKQGVVLKKNVSSRHIEDLKKGILDAIFLGLCAVRSEVSHDDVLTVVVQNIQTATVLRTREEGSLKNYVESLDEVYDVIESLDCRYKVVYLEKYTAMYEVLNGEVEKMKLEGIDSLLEME